MEQRSGEISSVKRNLSCNGHVILEFSNILISILYHLLLPASVILSFIIIKNNYLIQVIRRIIIMIITQAHIIINCRWSVYSGSVYWNWTFMDRQ